MKPLIGSTIEIVDAQEPSLIGLRGTVSDESWNMLIIDDGKRSVSVEKRTIVCIIDGKRVSAERLLKTPAERIKRIQ